MKPGKPFAFGKIRAGTAPAALFIGLPGNPVSSFVTFLLLVRPLLQALQGADAGMPPALPLRADFDWPRADRRREFLRVRRNDSGGLDLFANQSSGVLTSTVWADGLVDNPPGQAIRARRHGGFPAAGAVDRTLGSRVHMDIKCGTSPRCARRWVPAKRCRSPPMRAWPICATADRPRRRVTPRCWRAAAVRWRSTTG